MTATLTSWIPAFDVCESWTVVSRKQKKFLFSNTGSKVFVVGLVVRNAPFFKCVVPVLALFPKSQIQVPLFLFLEVSLALQLHDPAIKPLERLLQVRAREGVVSGVPLPLRRQSGSGAEAPSCRVPSRRVGPHVIGLLEVCETDFSKKVGASAASAIAGESKEIIELLEVWETDFPDKVGASVAAATAGECKGINGLLEVIESEFSAKSGAAAVAATVGSETADQVGVLHGTSSSLFFNSRIHPLDICHEFMGRLIFHMHVHARLLLLLCLLVLHLGLPLPLLHGFHVRLLQLLLMLQVHVPHLSIIVHLIQGVLVVCCLCANPPVTTWRCVARVPRGGRVPKVGFPVRPKICVLSQRWRQG